MKKIVLAIDELRVASFETTAETDGSRGTVRGYATALCTPFCAPRTYPDNTCQAGSCVDTCLVPRTGNNCYLC